MGLDKVAFLMASFSDFRDEEVTKLSFINELIGALNNRRAVVGLSAVDELIAGDDMQDFEFWEELQQALEAAAVLFVDHDQATPTYFSGAGEVPLYTLTTWRAEAGMHADGFRRVPDTGTFDPGADDWTDLDDPMFSHGIHEAGDICIAPWIFDDLQRGIVALVWTTKVTGIDAADSRSAFGNDPVCTLAKIDAENAWTASSWTGFGVFAYLAASQIDNSIFRVTAQRARSTPIVTVPLTAPCAVDFYHLAIAPAPGVTFVDVDSIGFVEDEILLHDTDAAIDPPETPRGGAGVVDPIGDFASNPITVNCGTTPDTQGIFASGLVVLKWEFEIDALPV